MCYAHFLWESPFMPPSKNRLKKEKHGSRWRFPSDQSMSMRFRRCSLFHGSGAELLGFWSFVNCFKHKFANYSAMDINWDIYIIFTMYICLWLCIYVYNPNCTPLALRLAPPFSFRGRVWGLCHYVCLLMQVQFLAVPPLFFACFLGVTTPGHNGLLDTRSAVGHCPTVCNKLCIYVYSISI